MPLTALPATHPEDYARLDTDGLRDRFLAADLFATPGEVGWALAADDRMLLGGVDLAGAPVTVSAPPELGTADLLARRELGVVCLDGTLTVQTGGERWTAQAFDVVFLGRRPEPAEPADQVVLGGTGRAYLVSVPAHTAHRSALARHDEVFAAELGEQTAANVRTVRRYVHADGVASANLVLGITTLAPGSVWNTMPPHVHPRRTEVYLYTGLGPTDRVLHLTGPPTATRSLVVADGQAVVSPGWSVHCGAGTGAYSFVWAMAGENQDYADMDAVDLTGLR